MAQQAKTFISEQDFNEAVKKRPNPRPESDSQGDSGDDEGIEAMVGAGYESEDDEETVLADTPADPSEDSEHEKRPNDRGEITDSERPDPRADLDSATSTH